MSNWTEFEKKARSLVDQNLFSSIEWEIFSEGTLVNKNLIYSHQSSIKLAASQDPIYRIYSMTKPIVAAAALVAVGQNRLNLNDPISNFLPGFSNPTVEHPSGLTETLVRPISILDLLTHNSGLSYGFNNDCHVGQQYKKNKLIHKAHLSLKKFVEELSKYPLAFQPGTAWRYSLSIDVLARILEEIYENSIENILTNLIFDPLEMIDTKFFIPRENIWRLMPIFGESDLDSVTDGTSHKKQGTAANLTKFYSPIYEDYEPRGGHGLFSTIRDYVKFCKMLLDGLDYNDNVLISKNLLKFALENKIPKDQIPIKINNEPLAGYGWNLLGRVTLAKNKEEDNLGDQEFGWAGAAATYFWIKPRTRTIGVIMTQQLGHEFSLGEELKQLATEILCHKDKYTSF